MNFQNSSTGGLWKISTKLLLTISPHPNMSLHYLAKVCVQKLHQPKHSIGKLSAHELKKMWSW